MKTKRLLLRSFIVALAGLWLGGSPSAHTATAADEGYKTVGGVTVYLGVVAAEIIFRCERRSRAADDSQDWPEKRTGRAGSFGLSPADRVVLHPSDRVRDGVRVAEREQ